MKYYRKERNFFFGIINDNNIDKFHYDGYNGCHIELPTFTVKVWAHTEWRHYGQGKEVKDETFMFWKPTLERVSKYNDGNHIQIRITSPNHLELSIEMTRNKQGDWYGDAYIYNHNKKWRWSEHKSNGRITETYCDPFMKYFLYRMEIL